MKITVVEVDEKKLWEGVKVKNIRSGRELEIFFIPEGKTISQCVKEGSFILSKHVDYQTVMLNKNLFELIPE